MMEMARDTAGTLNEQLTQEILLTLDNCIQKMANQGDGKKNSLVMPNVVPNDNSRRMVTQREFFRRKRPEHPTNENKEEETPCIMPVRKRCVWKKIGDYGADAADAPSRRKTRRKTGQPE
jgi:hypothetical protein